VWFATNYAEDVNLPYIFTVWDVEYLRQPWFPEVSRHGEWELRDRYYTRYLTKATRVIVPNEAGTEQLLRYFRLDRDRILELHHPTPQILDAAGPEGLDAEHRARHGVSKPYMFYPAQLWPHKSHAVLLEALAQLPDLDLILVGSDKGNAEMVAERAAQLGVADRVHVLGFVESDVLVALYRGAVALVYPSVFGPENLPPLEAFALGCPVVAADIRGAAEQLGDAALRVPPGDAAGFAAAVQRIRGDGALRERLTAAGRERAAQHSPRSYVDGVFRFLDEFEAVRSNWP
jgi:glycosyltransferase involved in cell wall biosynthesis